MLFVLAKVTAIEEDLWNADNVLSTDLDASYKGVLNLLTFAWPY